MSSKKTAPRAPADVPAKKAPEPVYMTATPEEVERAEREVRAWADAPQRFQGRRDVGRSRLDHRVAALLVARFLGGTVPRNLEVRHTPVPNWDLKVNPDNSDTNAYLLATGTAKSREFALLGWLWGHEAKRKEWKRTDLPITAYQVPRCELRSALALWLVVMRAAA